MACYVAACVGLYRLALCFVRHSMAWLAVVFFALNPGLLYFSTTALTELMSEAAPSSAQPLARAVPAMSTWTMA